MSGEAGRCGRGERIGARPLARLDDDRTSFVGRAAEAGELDALWKAGARLVTVVGTAGAGKTRLVRHWAARRLAALEDDTPAWFADLTEAAEQADVEALVAQVLSLQPGTDTPIDEALRHALAARGRILLVLDNFEQVAAHAPRTVGRWLDAAPEARFLVTSREPLGLRGERCVDVGPLSGDESIALFVDRARASCPSFRPSDRHRAVIGEIARRLDRLPLALELAAARADVLSPPELLDRLGESLALLRTDRRDATGHATLEQAIEWSWRLLGAGEREALLALSVFRGGFTLEAAEAVVDVGPGPSALELVHALARKSLVRVGRGPGEGLRLGLYESVRTFAAAKLPAAVAEGVLARHAAFFADRADSWARGVHDAGGAECLGMLAAEADNLAAAHRWGLGKDAAVAARTALALSHLMSVRGLFDPLQELLVGALEVVSRAKLRSLEPPLRVALGDALRRRGRPREARRQLERAARRARALGDRMAEAEALAVLGSVLNFDGAGAVRARATLRRSLSLSGPAASGPRAIALSNLGIVEQDAGRMRQSLARYEDALADCRTRGDRLREGAVLNNLGLWHGDHAESDRAKTCFEQALAIHVGLGDRRSECIALINLGWIEHERGDPGEDLCRRALVIARELGNLWLEAEALCALGMIDAHAGRFPAAHHLLGESASLSRVAGEKRLHAMVSCFLAAIDALEGRAERARSGLASARRFLERTGDPGLTMAGTILEGTVDLALRSQALRRGDRTRAAALLRSARRRLATRPRANAAEIRFARRLLERALEQTWGRGDQSVPTTIEVSADGRWFRLGHGRRITLGRSRPLRLILLRLAEQHAIAADRGLTVDDLLEAGWPGQRVMPDAGAHRVHVAVATLRAMGLKGHLVTRDDGYLLDPCANLVRLPAGG